ncbi:MAG: hypothetical protein KKC46_05670 [Proteobacteria bacterium]|nr:hypothetical protein [Pseudomonadota bacterium]
MKPLYFPFTYINDAKAANMRACFKQITVYQPGFLNLSENMQKLSDEGLLDIRVPGKGDEAKLKALLNEYKAWAELHQKSDMAFLNATEEKHPFFDETFPSQLASQIKKNMGGNQEKLKTDFLFNSRLFLGIAQEYDQQQEAIINNLASVSEMEKKLLADLTDEDENIFSNSVGAFFKTGHEPQIYKIKERLEAWIYLLINDKEKPCFFITESKDTIDFIIETNPDFEKVIDLQKIPVCFVPDIMDNWQIMLAKQVEGLLSDKNFKVSKDINNIPAVNKTERNVSLKIFRISNKSRYEFFQNILAKDIDVIQNDDKINKCILIGIVE